MILYEVNLNIQKAVYPEFKTWLGLHMSEMLQIDGFESATVYRVEHQDNDLEILSVVYQLRDRQSLEHYFIHQAEKMRGDGLARFEGQFTATRRILSKLP